MNVITKSVQLPDGRTITIETGKVAKQADGLVGDAESVEFWSDRIHCVFLEVESTIFAQFYGVYFYRAVKTDILQIEHRVLCLGNITVDMKFLVVTRS